MNEDFTDYLALTRKWMVAVFGFTALHDVDHVIRGIDGWPLVNPHLGYAEVNGFSFSLAVFPLVIIGFFLKGKVAAVYWLILSLFGLALVADTHFVPNAIDSLDRIVAEYHNILYSSIALVVFGCLFVSLMAGLYFSARTVMAAFRKK